MPFLTCTSVAYYFYPPTTRYSVLSRALSFGKCPFLDFTIVPWGETLLTQRLPIRLIIPKLHQPRPALWTAPVTRSSGLLAANAPVAALNADYRSSTSIAVFHCGRVIDGPTTNARSIRIVCPYNITAPSTQPVFISAF